MSDEQNKINEEIACEKCEEYLNNWKRALADYQNLQKDLARERQQMRVYAVTHAAELFLPIYDHFRMAFEHVPTDLSEHAKQWLTGMQHIKSQYEQALKMLGLEEIPAEGTLDTRLHEVVGSEQQQDTPDDTIIRVVQAGYRCNGAIVRPAKVIVVKNNS